MKLNKNLFLSCAAGALLVIVSTNSIAIEAMPKCKYLKANLMQKLDQLTCTTGESIIDCTLPEELSSFKQKKLNSKAHCQFSDGGKSFSCPCSGDQESSSTTVTEA